MKRLGVLGTAVLDTIRRPDSAAPLHALGGITYSLAAFAARPPHGWTLLPLLKVGRDAEREIRSFLGRLPGVEATDGVRSVEALNNRVELAYAPDGSRTERLTGGVPGWSLDELRPLAARCDALYLNLIAGWEVGLETARRLSHLVPGPTYCDLHSLLLDQGADGVRRPRVPVRWREWTRCFDYLQMNRDELELLAAEAGTDGGELARELAAARPRAVFVTLGREGARWYAGGEGAQSGFVPVPEASAAGDTTGCGDVWGMACFARLLEGQDPEEAARRANVLAAVNARLAGASALLDAAEEGGRER